MCLTFSANPALNGALGGFHLESGSAFKLAVPYVPPIGRRARPRSGSGSQQELALDANGIEHETCSWRRFRMVPCNHTIPVDPFNFSFSTLASERWIPNIYRKST